MADNKCPLMVTIQCFTYNQEKYIRECLEGFVMQKTSFRYVAIVHDDASTDKTPLIVKEYAEKYPDVIIPVLETENQYSKHDGSLERVMDQYSTGKYIAMCDGDDYWTSPNKLQIMVDFLENHLDYSFVFHAHNQLSPDGTLEEIRPYKHSVEVFPMKDVIMKGGMISVGAMCYRRSMLPQYPEWAKNLPVGDIPLRLLLAASGRVAYIDELMSCYRIGSEGSWTERMANNKALRKSHYKTMRTMWLQFDKWTNHKYIVPIIKKIYSIDKNYWGVLILEKIRGKK